MRRVVVTGLGIWSCLGQDLLTVTESLRQGRSGIVFDPKRIEYGLQSGLVGNVPIPDVKAELQRYFRDKMSDDGMYAYCAAKQALTFAHVVTDEYLLKNSMGILWGNDGNPSEISHFYTDYKNIELSPSLFYRYHTSSTTSNLANIFGLHGISLTIEAACASSSHAIGLALMFIRTGMQDTILVGGSCSTNKESAVAIDAATALSLKNNNPLHASRPFDKDRDGFVISGGAAALVLEEYEHAVERGATILAEVCGYGFSSNGIEEISMPSADGEYIAMKRALDDAGLLPADIDYVNAHATSTPLGDIEEAKALTRLFVKENQIINHKSEIINRKPYVSSTKSMTGHENWMAGASEAVYSILMMQKGFVAPNINLENVIDEAKDLNIARETIYTPINTVLSNSSGMGGTNSALVFKKI